MTPEPPRPYTPSLIEWTPQWDDPESVVEQALRLTKIVGTQAVVRKLALLAIDMDLDFPTFYRVKSRLMPLPTEISSPTL